MKKIGYIFSALIGLALSAGLAGCGDGDNDDDLGCTGDPPVGETINNKEGILYFDRDVDSWAIGRDSQDDFFCYFVDDTYTVDISQYEHMEIVYDGETYYKMEGTTTVQQIPYIHLTSLEARTPVKGEKLGTVKDSYGTLSYSQRFERWIIMKGLDDINNIDNFFVFLLDKSYDPNMSKDTTSTVLFSGTYYKTDARMFIATEMICYIDITNLTIK